MDYNNEEKIYFTLGTLDEPNMVEPVGSIWTSTRLVCLKEFGPLLD